MATVPPLLVQPAAAADVGDALVTAVLREPAGVTEVAGPEPQDLVDMARRTLAVRGDRLRLVPTWRGPFGPDMAGDVLLPGPDAVIAPTTFEQWLAAQRPTATPAGQC